MCLFSLFFLNTYKAQYLLDIGFKRDEVFSDNMDKVIIAQLQKVFEECARQEEGIEFWLARDLQKLLEYDEWRNFQNVIEKAKIACKKSQEKAENHFVDINKTIPMPKIVWLRYKDPSLPLYTFFYN